MDQDFIVLSLLPENKYDDEYELLTSYVDGRLPKVMALTASAWPNPTPTHCILFSSEMSHRRMV